ncbi:MAG: hypothetical protein PGN20_04245 [Agrobacterium cavarae]
MADGFAKFISLDMSLSDQGRGQTLRSFAMKMVFISISLSIVISLAVILIGSALGLLPVPLAEAVSYSIAMGWIVGAWSPEFSARFLPRRSASCGNRRRSLSG